MLGPRLHEVMCMTPEGRLFSTQHRSQLRAWLDEPMDVRRLANSAFLGGLALLLAVPGLPQSAAALLFWVALVGGIASVSFLVYAPDKDWRGVSVAALPLIFMVHLVVALASIRQGFYVKFMSGASLGGAIKTSLWFVLLEWGAAAAYGRSLSEADLQPLRRRAVVIPALGFLSLMLVTSVFGPVLALERGYGVGSGRGPAGYVRRAVPRIVHGIGYKPATAIVQGQVLIARLKQVPDPHYDGRDMVEYGLLGFSLAEQKHWSKALPAQPLYRWDAPELALGPDGAVLMAMGNGSSPCWVATFDRQTGFLLKTEEVVRAPWLEPESGVSKAATVWREAPFTDESGIVVEIEPQQRQAWIRGANFGWYLYGDPEKMEFAVSRDIIVVRTLDADQYWYDMFLLPAG